MLVFIDDSGDPGFKIGKGSSSHFVIACVIFDDELAAEETAVAIKKYRRQLGFTENMEFKFSKSRPEIKSGFLKTIKSYNFRIRAIVVDKRIVRSDELKNSQDSFYNYFIKQVLLHNRGTIINSKVRLDGHGNRLFRKGLTTYLRRELNYKDKKVLQKLKLVNSKTNVLIQMADMVAGAIRRSYDPTKKDAKVYYKIIQSKIENCWKFK